MKDTGGRAFPTTLENYDNMRPAGAGMTLRDYFAAKAMQGLITSRHKDFEDGWYDEDVVAKSAYQMADAMLAERSKE